MSVSETALQRSLKAITFGIAAAVETKRVRNEAEGLLEREEQFQLPISGAASPTLEDAIWVETVVDFEMTFSGNARGMRDADFEEPTCWFGYVVESGGPVMVAANVIAWRKSAVGDIVGARLAATAIALGASVSEDPPVFSGFLHATFQGWGAPTDNFDDPEGPVATDPDYSWTGDPLV